MKNLTIIMLLTLGLVACNNDNNVAVNPTPDPVTNQLKNLALLNADDEPSAIGNVTDLSNDINALFDGIEPVDVNESDDIITVINKAEGI